jgi:hypothetical protein
MAGCAPSPSSTPQLTGLAATGARFNGASDGSWSVTCAPTATSGLPCPVGTQPAQRVTDGFNEWLIPQAGAAWVGMGTTGSIPGGSGDNRERYVYTYRLSFTLVGTPSTATLSLNWACDNYFRGWRLNGGTFRDGQSQNFNWRTLQTLSISGSNATFVTGTNTLEFQVVGDGETDGFLAVNLSGSVR